MQAYLFVYTNTNSAYFKEKIYKYMYKHFQYLLSNLAHFVTQKCYLNKQKINYSWIKYDNHTSYLKENKRITK